MQIIVPNPPRRKRRLSAAQKAALARGRRKAAANRKRRRTSTTPRKKSGVRTMATRRRTYTRRRKAPTRRRRSYARKVTWQAVLTSAAAGTVGVIAANKIIPKLPLPAQLQTPVGIGATQIALGFIVASFGKKFLKKWAEPMGVGIATAGVQQIAYAQFGAQLQGYPLSGYNSYPMSGYPLSGGAVGAFEPSYPVTEGVGSGEYEYEASV